MSQPAKAPETNAPETEIPEPSIDEILASIRRSIVPDDDAGSKPSRKSGRKAAASAGTTRSRRPDSEAARTPAEGGGQGTDSNTTDGNTTAKAAERAVDSRPDAASSVNGAGRIDVLAEDGVAGAPVEAAPMAGSGIAPAQDSALLSPRTTAAVDTAFASLASTMLSNTVLSPHPRTLDDLVRDMLKPMLKAWLDAHLPDMVERLVRAEIERVSRRGKS
jgi:cell pole-organizing protein PopZ